MKETIAEFKKNKDFLVCVDSDGCAMDTKQNFWVKVKWQDVFILIANYVMKFYVMKLLCHFV